MKKYMSVEEAAAELGVHPATVRRWVQVGHIKASRPGLRAFRIPASEVARLLEMPADARMPSDEVQSNESITPSLAAALPG